MLRRWFPILGFSPTASWTAGPTGSPITCRLWGSAPRRSSRWHWSAPWGWSWARWEFSNPAALVTEARIAGRLPAGPWRAIALDSDAPLLAREPSSPPAGGLSAEDLAYVIYTSG